MTATILKTGSAVSGPAVPKAFKLFKERVYDTGGFIKNEADCAAAFAFAAKHGITTGFAASPSWGVRLMDSFNDGGIPGVDKLYSLFDSGDLSNPYVPNSSSWRDFPFTEDEGFDSVHFQTGETWSFQPITSLPQITVSTSYVGMVAVRSPNANTGTEGYLIAKGTDANVARRVSISNEPTGGSSRLRCQVGTSVWGTAYGATKASLDRWKVSGVYCSTTQIKSIEDGAVANTTASVLLLATDYRVQVMQDANGSGTFNSRPAEAWLGEAWAIPDASEAFALALNARMAAIYEA
jgi:hypothetical protein